MILFKQEHVDPILTGQKTQTRRTGEKRWNVGAIHQARTNMPWQGEEGYFADIKILAVWKENLSDILLPDIEAEGYKSFEGFKEIWVEMNGEWDPELEVYVVEFEVVKNYVEVN